ncbi:MAG: nucleotide exchange factor GrpE [Halobacteriaceae archaeon]
MVDENAKLDDTESVEDESTGNQERVTTLAAEVSVHDESLGAEVAELKSELDELQETNENLEDEIEELKNRLQRTQADFQNYKKRAEKRQEEIKERATEDLVERLLEVRDNLARALEHDDQASIQEGIEATLRQFDDILADENVSKIEPQIGTKPDPVKHEVVSQVESEQDPGNIADVYRPGYEMAGSVIRPAQITVSKGSADEDQTAPSNEE